MLRDGLTNVRRLQPVVTGVLGTMRRQQLGPSPDANGRAIIRPIQGCPDHASRATPISETMPFVRCYLAFGWTRIQQMPQEREFLP